jgi:hypothetical protein
MKRTPIKRGKPLTASKPLRKQSLKRKSYRQSAARADGVAHMLAVKELPCICCGHPPPSYAHHVTGDKMPRDDLRVLPLCYACHQGPDGYHAAKRSWVAKHGPDYMLLDRVAEMLNGTRPAE